MMSYLSEGIYIACRCVLLGVIIYIIGQGILLLANKRSFKDYKSISKVKLLSELLLVIYVCTILNITGIIGREFSCDFSILGLRNFLNVPFVGASIKMVTLNFLLFVPYGFLVDFVFKKFNLTWGKALLIGFCSSLFIELVQAFIGRLPENDDLIANTTGFLVGFLIVQAMGKIRSKETRKKGMIQLISTLIVTVIVLFLLSFVANGDSIQEEQDGYYNGIGNNDEEIPTISGMNIYKNGTVYDVLNSSESDCYTWYSWMGTDISNKSGRYIMESQSINMESIVEEDKTYIEVEYAEPQLFRFYNNTSWEMVDVRYLVFCIEDGTLWYGSDKDVIEYFAYYADTDSLYQPDGDLLYEVDEWLTNRN